MNKGFPAGILLTLLAASLVGGTLLAAEENKQKGVVAGDNKIPVTEKNQTKKAEKSPANFISTEEVSADQAVAFPTDI